MKKTQTPKSIIATMNGETFKRYSVDPEDFDLFWNPESTEWDAIPSFFGAQAIRKGGLDEQYRSLCGLDVEKVTVKF